MKLKGFDHLELDPSGEIKVDVQAAEAEAEAAAETGSAKISPEAKAARVDRRPKAQKPVYQTPDDSPDRGFFEQAQKELSLEGLEYTPQDIHDRALKIKFRGMQSNTFVDKAAEAYVEEAVKQFNADMTAEFKVQREKDEENRRSPRPAESPETVVRQQNTDEHAARKYETEQRRKWQEVDRVESIEQERKREEEDRVRALKGGGGGKKEVGGSGLEDAEKERIEQKRKREEVLRVEALEQERKREEEERVRSLKAPEKAENKKPSTLREIIFGKK